MIWGEVYITTWYKENHQVYNAYSMQHIYAHKGDTFNSDNNIINTCYLILPL